MTVREVMGRLRSTDPVLWGLGLTAAVLIYTLVNLTTRSLWWDELFTLAIANPTTPDADAVAQVRGDVHLPLYFFSARLWLQLLNTSNEFALRAFNLIPYAFAVWTAVLALRGRSDRPMALWFVLFFSSFGVFWYLQEARMYSMMIAQALCGCVVVMGYEKRRLEPVTFGYVAMLAATFVLLPLSHWFSLAFAGCLLIGLSLWSLAERRMQFVLLFVGNGIALAGLGGAWILLNSQATIGAVNGYGGWVQDGALSLWGLRQAASETLLFTLTFNPVLIVAAGLGAWLIVRSPRRQIGPVIILAASAFLVLAILAVSLKAPMYQTRNFMWLIAPLTLFAATGLESVFARWKLSRTRQGVALLGTLVLSLTIAPYALSQMTFDQWRGAGRFVASIPGCETADVRATAYWLDPPRSVVDYRYSQRIFGYYAGHSERVKLVLKREKLTIDQTSPCPVALWMPQIREDAAAKAAREIFGPTVANGLRVQVFFGHVIFLRARDEGDPA